MRTEQRAAALGMAIAVAASGCIPHPQFGPEIDNYHLHQQTAVPSECSGEQPAVREFANALVSVYPETAVEIERACNDPGAGDRSPTSLHKSGRAIDWYIRSMDPSFFDAFIHSWLFAKDGFGYPHAIARRLGLTEIIYKARRYSTQTTLKFAGESSSGHFDHVHMGFSKASAMYRLATWWGPPASCDATRGWRWDGTDCVYRACSTNVLASGRELLRGQSVKSCDGKLKLLHQSDGNVVLYRTTSAGTASVWNTETHGKATRTFRMQSDGNLVLYATDWTPLFASHTNGQNGSWLAVGDDCKAVVFTSKGKPIWGTGTACS